MESCFYGRCFMVPRSSAQKELYFPTKILNTSLRIHLGNWCRKPFIGMLLLLLLLLLSMIIHDYWVSLSSVNPFQVYYEVRRLLQSATEHREHKGFEWNFRQRFQEDKYSLELSIKYVTPFVTLFTLLVFACCVVISRSIAI